MAGVRQAATHGGTAALSGLVGAALAAWQLHIGSVESLALAEIAAEDRARTSATLASSQEASFHALLALVEVQKTRGDDAMALRDELIGRMDALRERCR